MTAQEFGISVAAFGAALQELYFWYAARTELSKSKYNSLLKSVRYWVVVALMVAASGFGTWVWFSPEQQAARTYLLMGAAFPIFFKKLVAAFISKETKLGAKTETTTASLRDYFAVSR